MLTPTPTPDAEAPEPYWKGRPKCAHGHTQGEAKRAAFRLMRTHRPFSMAKGGTVWHFALCANTRGGARANVQRIVRLRKWRRRYEHKWPIRVNRLPSGWVQWARNITACESGWNRYASNGSHFSFYQWAPSTWATASSGFNAPASPYNASWHHQTVIAVHWAWRAGTSQWVCRG